MKNFLILLSFLFVFNHLYSQYCNTATTNIAITPTTTQQLSPIYNSGRRAFNFQATAGCTYVFETCGLSTVDTYLRLYSTATGGVVLAQDDDGCGTQSRITWTANTTATVSILLTRFNCNTLNANAQLRYYIQSCAPPENTVPFTGNNSYTLCSDVLYDNGGSGGNYANNSNGFTVINPATAGSMVQLTGNIDTEFGYDFVRIYNGNGTGGTLLWQGSGVQNIGTITSTSGSLTVQFTSDGSVTRPGFALNISCITPSPPSCANTPTPTNGSTNISLSQQLSWPAVSGATGYDVYFGTTNPANTLVSSNQSGTTYNPGTLNPNTTYYWRVVPRNSVGFATGCSTWSFTTIAPGPCLNTFSKMVLVIQPTNFWADEVGYTLFNSSSVTIQSGNGFPSNVTSFVYLEGQSQPYTLNIETQGLFNDNSINYSVFCGNDLIASGSLGGGQSINLTNLQCNFNMPTQSTPSVLSACSTYGLYTDEYSEWTGGVAGTDYVVTSGVPTDWITITSVTPNGTVVAFGNSPLIWTAPNNGTYFIHVSTNGFCGQDANCRNITVERPSPLPVTLTSFTTECNNEIPVLKWTTASEQNSDYFQIERSRDGFEWVEVSKVQAMGNSNTTKNYQFYDMTSGSNFEGYYRLKQVDFDGNFEYFDPKYILCGSNKTTYDIEVFPNPVKEELFTGIRNSISGDGTITITDFSGKIVKQEWVSLSDGYNLINLDVKDLSNGIYIIKIISNDVKFVGKFIKN